MKIWFDISNSPHVNLFSGLIKELSKSHEVIITCRPLANTSELLDVHGFDYTVVGRHYGKSLIRKILGYPMRVYDLFRFLAGKGVDVAVSQAGFHSPVVARLLGIRSVYMNDNEHAVANIPAFLFANRVLIPEFLDEQKVRRRGAWGSRLFKYPGVKEGIYLSEFLPAMRDRKRSDPMHIYIRPEPWLAHYYTGATNFLDELIKDLSRDFRITVLPRGSAQAEHYKSLENERVRVLSSAIDLSDILVDCDLFIGAGGTMTREMAVLGIPTISTYQAELLDVDRFLLAEGTFEHDPDLTAETVREFAKRVGSRPPNAALLEKGSQAYRGIREMVLEGHSARLTQCGRGQGMQVAPDREHGSAR